MMEALHLTGISLIVKLQDWFQNLSGPMIWLSHVGNPALAFTFFFPVSYCIHPSIGKRVMWVAVITEWLNAVFKWILHGERPYWWIHETTLYQDHEMPYLRQFNITCETGPGSPSGHTMVSSAVMYVMLSDLIRYREVKGECFRFFCWMAYLFVCLGICVSRLYVAAHFPHQVIAGFFVGVIFACLFNVFSTSSLQLKHYLLATSVMAVSTVITYYSLQLTNVDPLWSVTVAVRWCALKEWIHLYTSTFYAIVRDLASLLGLGVAGWTLKNWNDRKVLEVKSIKMMLIQIILSLLLSSVSERLKIFSDHTSVLYTMCFLKHFSTVFIIVSLVSALNTVSWI